MHRYTYIRFSQGSDELIFQTGVTAAITDFNGFAVGQLTSEASLMYRGIISFPPQTLVAPTALLAAPS